MGSISDYIDCPQCGKEAHHEMYYKTGEEHILCLNCGYSRKFEITNWEEREDPDLADRGIDWQPKYEMTELKGYGAYRIRGIDSMGYEVGGFDGPGGAEEFIELVNNRVDEIAHAEYTEYRGGEWYTTVLVMGDREREEE